jgi:Clostripain family
MNIKSNKKWSVLIYADGNNEMEQVIYNSFNSCINSNVAEDVTVIMEIGLLGNRTSSKNNWCGVRRYCINSKEAKPTQCSEINCNSNNASSNIIEPILIEDMGAQNMADPNNLYNFISWGMKTYPADNHMVIISGHGTDFVGCLTDESSNNHYIMGIPEMAKAIYLGCKSSKSIIDILVLDMCFMNSIEILYEFSQYDNFIKTMITYTGFAPYEGLAYERLINFISCNGDIKDLNKFITEFISALDFHLTAYRLDKTQLDKIKQILNDLALYYLTKFSKTHQFIKSAEENQIINYIKEVYPQDLEKINSEISSIIIHSKSKFMGLNSSINITSADISGLIKFYRKLAFAKSNYWTKLLNILPTAKEMGNINKVKVRALNSTASTIHYLLELNPLVIGEEDEPF